MSYLDKLDNANKALAELAIQINASHDARLGCYRTSFDHAVVTGQRLIKAKEITRGVRPRPLDPMGREEL
jgi:hypothetical protein